MYFDNNWAVIVPMANEEQEFDLLVNAISKSLDRLKSGTVYFVIDKATKDRTLELSQELSGRDARFITIWAPENKNVVDAYLRGYREAYQAGHEFIIEMDAGLSHDPAALPLFLRVLNEGNECAFGSRFINGGSTADSAWKRRFLSKFGTTLSSICLGTKMKDMTSGYQGFSRAIVEKFLAYNLQSKAHFYQTELRYLLRYSRYMEVPIHYRAPSPSVSDKAIKNSIACLIYYTKDRFFGKKIALIQPH